MPQVRSSRPRGVLVDEKASAGAVYRKLLFRDSVAESAQRLRVSVTKTALSTLKLVLSGPPQRSELARPGSAPLAWVVAGGGAMQPVVSPGPFPRSTLVLTF